MSKKIILALFIFAFVILILPKNTYALEANVKTAIDNLDFDRKSKNEINLYFSIRSLSDFVEVIALAIDRYDSWEVLDRKSRDRLWAKLWIG